MDGLVTHPSPILQQQARPVDDPKSETTLAKRMRKVVREHDGLGLAAPQIGVLKQVFVLREGDEGPFRAYFNPEIITSSGTQSQPEECLSVPDRTVELDRPEQIRFQARTVDGAVDEVVVTDYQAIAVQHEIDHLSGRTILDRVQN